MVSKSTTQELKSLDQYKYSPINPFHDSYPHASPPAYISVYPTTEHVHTCIHCPAPPDPWGPLGS